MGIALERRILFIISNILRYFFTLKYWLTKVDQIILPNSPHLIISIADRMRNPNQLSKLKKQAKAFDDKNALNWILGGQAKVTIVPLLSVRTYFRS